MKAATITRKVILHNEIESRIEQTALALGVSLSLSLSHTHTHICFFTLAMPKHCTSSEKGREAQFATSINTNFFFGWGVNSQFYENMEQIRHFVTEKRKKMKDCWRSIFG